MGGFKQRVGTPLANTGLIDEFHLEKLRALSVTTVEELLGLVRADPEALQAFTEVTDLAQMQADAGIVAPQAVTAVTRAAADFRDRRFAMGAKAPLDVDVEEIAKASTFEGYFAPGVQPVPAGTPGTGINLRSCWGPIRDQGQRGTCVGHAGAAVVECLHHQLHGAVIDLSPQFLFYNSKQRDGASNEDGTWSAVAIPTLMEQGICEEQYWPYQGHVIPGDLTHGSPSPEAFDNGLLYLASGFTELNHRSSLEIRVTLDQRQPVTISIPVYSNWYTNPATEDLGLIPMPLPTSFLEGGHAMCVVGYDFDDDFTGGGYFMLRNSWGTDWARNSPIQPGYGVIPFQYLDSYGWEAYTVTLA